MALSAYLGAQLDGRFALPNGTVLAPFLRLPWMHDFLPDRNVPRYFSALPEDVFSGMGTPSVANAAVIHIGATGNLVYRW